MFRMQFITLYFSIIVYFISYRIFLLNLYNLYCILISHFINLYRLHYYLDIIYMFIECHILA